MTKFKHHSAEWSADVDVAADDFIEAVADWGGILKYLPPEHPFKFTHVSLADGSQGDRLPLTRTMHLDKSVLSPEQVSQMPDGFNETLILVDRDARTLVYSVDGETLGMRNYYGRKEVDELGPNRCRARISVQFDYPADWPSDDLLENLIEVYKGIIVGVEQYYARG